MNWRPAPQPGSLQQLDHEDSKSIHRVTHGLIQSWMDHSDATWRKRIKGYIPLKGFYLCPCSLLSLLSGHKAVTLSSPCTMKYYRPLAQIQQSRHYGHNVRNHETKGKNPSSILIIFCRYLITKTERWEIAPEIDKHIYITCIYTYICI